MGNGNTRSPGKGSKNQPSMEVLTLSGHHPKQMPLFPVTEVEVDGIQMGVLSDGTPYLTLRGLARMCGIDHAALLRLANNWDEEKRNPVTRCASFCDELRGLSQL